MTLEELDAKVRQWDLQNPNGLPQAISKYSYVFDQLSYHARKEWKVYLPAEDPRFNSNFMERLAAWVGNIPDEADQKLLLEYALYISFFSHDDFTALYRTALAREIGAWVAAQVGARLEPHGGQGFHDRVYEQIHLQTWFCPVTDSMDINEFFKVNHLQGVGHRPAFATLQMLAERAGTPNQELARSVAAYMANPSTDPTRPRPPLTRLVLLEDIVGSGSQCLDAIRWAVANLGVPVLFVPLILCPNGLDALRQEQRTSGGRLEVRPVIQLHRGDLIGPERQAQQGWPIAVALEDLAQRCANRASPGIDTFGFRNTGCSLVTFANTPDNTIPMIHNRHRNSNWDPLFPRVFRD